MSVEDSSLASMALPSCLPSPPFPAAVEHIRRAGFTLIEELGRDDHGTLHKARGRLGRVVSIFVLENPAPLAGPAEVAKLEKQLTGLKHPAIVPVSRLIYDAKTGVVYAVVSKFFADQALAKWVGQNGLADAWAAVRLVLSLAEALEYAGRKGVFHGLLTRDMAHGLLALEKIRMGDDGSPRIAGFGLSRLGRGPKLSDATAQTDDVESLGAILQQLLSAMPAVPADLNAICRKPYATAGEFAADLRRFPGAKA